MLKNVILFFFSVGGGRDTDHKHYWYAPGRNAAVSIGLLLVMFIITYYLYRKYMFLYGRRDQWSWPRLDYFERLARERERQRQNNCTGPASCRLTLLYILSLQVYNLALEVIIVDQSITFVNTQKLKDNSTFLRPLLALMFTVRITRHIVRYSREIFLEGSDK